MSHHIRQLLLSVLFLCLGFGVGVHFQVIPLIQTYLAEKPLKN